MKFYNVNNNTIPLPAVMGILNLTPDSFSDGGNLNNITDVLKSAEKMLNDGARILDFGGESTRPGAGKVSEQDEIGRVLPAIKEVHKEFPEVVISIDTYKAGVAKAATDEGASIINDISGGTFDSGIVDVAVNTSCAYVLMHTTGRPEVMQQNLISENAVTTIYNRLSELAGQYASKGLKHIILDPGIGFGKSAEQNFEILSSIKTFKGAGYPVLIGLSRKSFIGKIFDLEINARDEISGLLEFYSLLSGADIIRTHSVKKTVQAITLMKLMNAQHND